MNPIGFYKLRGVIPSSVRRPLLFYRMLQILPDQRYVTANEVARQLDISVSKAKMLLRIAATAGLADRKFSRRQCRFLYRRVIDVP